MKKLTEIDLDIVGLRDKIKEWYDVDVQWVTYDAWDVWYLHKSQPYFKRGVWYSDWTYELGFEDDSPLAKGLTDYSQCIWRLV